MKQGFSLVELSIVLVILGLLTGGILAGQSLIRASELRAVTTEYNRYVAATNTFRDKYFAIPGDMNNATQFWGTAGTCPGTSASPSTSVATCNGDGNGQLSLTATNSNEVFRFWQHLANAGLIEGSYSGVSNSTTATDFNSLAGTNVPRSRVGNAGYDISWIGDQGISSTSFFEGSYRHIFTFGTQNATRVNSWVVKPEEMWNIDTKLDDGRPGSGIVVSYEAAGPTECHTATPSAAAPLAGTANYLLSNSNVNCAILFKVSF